MWACSSPSGETGRGASLSRTIWGLQIGHFSAPVLFGSMAFALKLSGMAPMWPNMAVSESRLGTFVLVGHEAVLQSFIKVFQKIGVCYSSKNGCIFTCTLVLDF